MKIRSFSQHFADRSPADVQAQLHNVLVLLPDLGVPLTTASILAPPKTDALDPMLGCARACVDESQHPKTRGIVFESLLVLRYLFALEHVS
jgi:hypothetical protein